MRIAFLPADRPPSQTCLDACIGIVSLADNAVLPAWVNTDALTTAEAERAANIRHTLARSQFERGRLLVRSILGTILNCSPNLVPISYSPDGKPHLADTSIGFYFNVSHTTGTAIVAIGRAELGVDVESIRDRDCAGLVKRYFATEEQVQFERLPNDWKLPGFVRGWTCKEALLKGTGAGVRDLQNCAVDLDPRCNPKVLRHTDTRSWKLAAWQIHETTVGAIAVTTDSELTLEKEE